MTAAALPPSRDSRGPAEIGTTAALELTFGVKNSRTALLDSYAEPPLRVGQCFESGHGVHLILASSAPGVFGGDTIRQSIRVEAGARVSLTSQSAMQIHPSSSGSVASLASGYEIAEGAELQCVWHPSIPFAGASVRQRIEVDIAPGGRLSWSDAMMCGREARGERWQFRLVDHEFRVRIGNVLGYMERYRIEPFLAPPSHRWAAHDAAYLGTILRVGYADDARICERLHAGLAGISGIVGAADLLDGTLLLVRIAASAGVGFHRARQAVAAMLDITTHSV